MPDANRKLEGPKLKIERASAHIVDLRARVTDFLSASPLQLFTAPGPGQAEECIKVRATAEVPGNIAIICGEIVYALRSALDQAACALAIQNGYSDVSGTYFPVAGSKEEYESKGTRNKVTKLHQDAVTVIDSFKPYKGGNDLLWALNKLGNTDKHQMLIPMAAANLGTAMNLSGRSLGIVEHTFKVPKTWQPVGPEATIFIYPAGMQLDGDLTVLTDISFRDIASITGQPIANVLEGCVALTEQIIQNLELRFFGDVL